MRTQSVVVFLVLAAVGLARATEWWESGNYYQIYPRSFRDSDGDGIGDLNGVTEKLQYLKDIGFTGTWLSPIFKSPMVDFGYDISDFYQIHPEYGTMEDFENLIAKAKEVGIKIILDFVPNHSSDENEWFKKSVDSDPHYKDYYIWHDGKINEETGEREPPSNWGSEFRYSAWEWNDVRQQYYLHQFAVQQPDLNYRNPVVVEEMKNIIRFWLAKGVSGFRIDAVPYLFEVDLDRYNQYPDEPLTNDSVACPDPDDHCYTQHIYTQNLPETLDMIYQWRELVDTFQVEHGGDKRLLLTEAYTSFETMIQYYGDGERNGSHIPFNFDFLSSVNNASTAGTYVTHIQKWMDAMPEGVYANWVLGNHDNKRVASRFGVQRTDLMNILLQTLPGHAVTYNGEELGMTDVWISWEDTVDPPACNSDPEHYYDRSRDPARTPYQWDASSKAGFTSADHTWLPVSDDYKTKNALQQLRAPRSHLQIFKKLVRVRKEPSFRHGDLNIQALDDDIIIYSRQKSDSDLYVIVLNLGGTAKTIDITKHYQLGSQAEIITTSLNSQHIDGDVINPAAFVANPYVGTVLVAVK
ncbi:maltase A1 [Drosophila guanche]|uniref:alpha-glucosidase n=1 Tax=Drosophila guanche TaxID=7266 RepID=A0A3B0JKC9_DROGU|nr:maltase A1 [Drosophila guanche]SPP73696.1 blast:Maltase A1 [Drosophila guanche]